MSRPGDLATARRCWRTLAENAAAAACEVHQVTEPVVQERRLKSIVAGARILKSGRISPGEGFCASVAAFAFLDLAAAWASPAVSPARREQLAPMVAAGAGAVEALLDEVTAGQRERVDIYG